VVAEEVLLGLTWWRWDERGSAWSFERARSQALVSVEVARLNDADGGDI
jgi:hypothetical protein